MSNDSNFDILETWRYEIQIDKKIKSEDTLPKLFNVKLRESFE